MKALILAAGRGSRLGQHTEDKPKCLLDLGGKSLIERSVENLLAAGCEKVGVVVGYRHKMIENLLEKKFTKKLCYTIMNPDYTRGSGSSIICAEKEFGEEILIVESDLLYDKKVVERLISPKKINALTMGFFHHGRKEVKIYLKDNYIEKAAWGEPDDQQANGEWVGITKLNKEASVEMKKMLQETDPNQGKEINYEYFVFELIRKMKFQAIYVQDLPWIEIDNDDDLKRALEEVYPRITKAS